MDNTNAQFIYDNYDNLDYNKRRELLMKYLTDTEVDTHLLKYELYNYSNKQDLTLSLDEFEEKALKLLDRYQWKAGGFKIEDSEFIVHKNNQKIYRVLSNELLFENTIDRTDLGDEETEYYLDNLMKQLNNLSKNIEVEYRYKNSENKTVRLLIWCTNKDMIVESDSDSDVVGL